MELCCIASGSSGNCTYAGAGETHVLIDAGISGKRIEEGLISIGQDPGKIDGILITHEHGDHIAGLGVLMRRYGMMAYATPETWCAIEHNHGLGKLPQEKMQMIQPDREFRIGGLEVNPFSIPHDAANPVGFSLFAEGHKISVATDIGCVPENLVRELEGSEILLLEANHDKNMLEVGPYPYVLKQRILGDRGHLSNDNTGKLLARLYHKNLRYVLLGHLSKENNYPALARETVLCELSDLEPGFLSTCSLEVARRNEPGELIVL